MSYSCPLTAAVPSSEVDMNFVVGGMPQQILSRIREVLNVSSPPTRSKIVHVKEQKNI